MGGVVRRDAFLKKKAGDYTVSRLATGRYAITIPGKSEASGMLLQNSGYLATQPSGNWTGTGTLLQSTNVVLPLSQWTIVPGNPSGTYMVTPATSGPQTFYRLRQ